MNKQNELLPNDRLSIFCEVSTSATANVSGQSECTIPQIRLSGDFGALLEKGLLTDCVLCADGKEFQAHKAVLACRSPVFAAMFVNDTEEKRTSKVNIEDISAPVLGQLLHFVYTGCEPKLLAEEGMAEGLLAAADKYQLDRFKALCEQELSIGLTNDNVGDALMLADRHNADQLKKRAIEYIKLRADGVNEVVGWRTLVSSRPELLDQLFKSEAGSKQTHQAS